MFEKEKQENRDQILEFEEGKQIPDRDWDGSVSFYPRYLQIEHTTRCNAKCIMCNHLYTGNRGAKDIDLDVLYALEDILKYAETVMLNGDGEPFLYRDIDKSLALFGKYEVKVGMNTNFTVVPEQLWNDMGHAFSFLNISCDGAEKDLYESIRKGLCFEDFKANLEKLNKVAPHLKKNMDCVLMRQNIGDMENLVRFAADYGFSSVRFHSLGINPIIGNEKDAPDLYPHYLMEQAQKAANAARERGIRIQLPRVQSPEGGDAAQDLEKIHGEEKEAEKRIRKAEAYHEVLSRQYLGSSVREEDFTRELFDYGDLCRWAVERCYIDLNGNLTTCCYDVSHRYGSLKEQTFEEIWNGPLYKKLRLKMREGKLPKWCGECQWLKNPEF